MTRGGNESGNDESGNDESGNDESGNDESGNDESGNDESGNDESGNDERMKRPCVGGRQPGQPQGLPLRPGFVTIVAAFGRQLQLAKMLLPWRVGRIRAERKEGRVSAALQSSPSLNRCISGRRNHHRHNHNHHRRRHNHHRRRNHSRRPQRTWGY